MDLYNLLNMFGVSLLNIDINTSANIIMFKFQFNVYC
jgi:hypothetical protein